MKEHELSRLRIERSRFEEARYGHLNPSQEDIVLKIYHNLSSPFFLCQENRRTFLEKMTKRAILPYLKFYAKESGASPEEISQLLRLPKSALVDYLVLDPEYSL